MDSTTHYHSTTHEVLCVYQGCAKLSFGGEDNPGKVEVVMEAGDAMIVPAGVGHRLVEDIGSSNKGAASFMMLGSYPIRCSWDMCYGQAGEEKQAGNVRDVKWLDRDPLYGKDGPALWPLETSGAVGKIEL